MAVEKQELIVKSNRLVEASYRLTLREQQLILYAICRAREEQRGLSANEPISIDAAAFAAQFGIDSTHAYEALKEAQKSLFDRYVTIHDTHLKSGKPRVTTIRWVCLASYVDGAGIVEMAFSPQVIPHITRLEQEFTSYRLEKIANMTSSHAIHLYELMLQYLPVGHREIALIDLKDMLGVAGEYRALKDFKKRVLDLAVAQINEHSDLKVSYTQRKTGRAVTHFDFTIKLKAQQAALAAAKAAGRGKRKPVFDQAYIEQHARPGESYDQAKRRLLEEEGQQRLNLAA